MSTFSRFTRLRISAKCSRRNKKMAETKLFAINAAEMPWEERFNERIGKSLFRKNLYTDQETGMEIRLVRYPAGIINPTHTHPCGHGMYVLEGTRVTHAGSFPPG